MRRESKSLKKSRSPLSGDDLDRLIARVKKGEKEAIEEVYAIYGGKILNYIYRMTRSRAEAEDLTQETFVAAFTKIHSLKENRKFQSWLYRIAQNNVYQKFRTRPPQHESIDAEEGLESLDLQKMIVTAKDPEARIVSEELVEIIEQVIDSLPQKYRDVFVLSAIHKFSYKEISEIVGRSLASVKSDIHRARLQVRDKVKSYLGKNYGMSGLF